MKALTGHFRAGRAGRSGWRFGGAGYSLVELMIALGILGVGMAMIGTLFPSGMLENKKSVDATMSTLISENAVGIVRASLTHSDMLSYWKNLEASLGTDVNEFALHEITHLIGLADRAYPGARGDKNSHPDEWFTSALDALDYPSSRYGWLVAIRHVRPEGWTGGEPLPNDYEIVILPYRKFADTDRPSPQGLLPPATAPELSCSGTDVASAKVEHPTSELSPGIGIYVVRTSLSP